MEGGGKDNKKYRNKTGRSKTIIGEREKGLMRKLENEEHSYHALKQFNR